jgi:UDP-N-acetylmuramyl pentapeptide phosphotransferase/UDP-N-acetylglucosamine-1-phosphate transferase
VIVVLALLVGIVMVRFLRMVSGDILASPALERRNYRNRVIPTAGGLYIVITVLLIEAGRAVIGALGIGDFTGLSLARSEMLFAVFGFGFLGLVDDLAGVGSERGFRGHIGALRYARVTTGLLKLVAGAAIAVVLVATPGFKSGRSLIVDALLIALAANLGNLLDRAPGRTIKGGLVVYVPLMFVLGTDSTGIALAPVMGASFGLLGDDLHERLMLGDTGANVIGAALGLGVVLGTEESTRIAVMLLLLLLNVAAELVSFSDVINRVPPLRWFDRLGGVHQAPGSATASGPSTAAAAAAPLVQDDVAEPLRPVPVPRKLRGQPGQAPEVLRRGDDDSADVV